MMTIKHALFLWFCFLNFPSFAQFQDTVKWQGFLNIILSDSYEFYPDKIFKWTSEYDLSWSEFGRYEVDGNVVTLKFFNVLEYNDLDLEKNHKPTRLETFLIEEEKIFRLNDKGEKVKKRKDRSFRTKWSWIFGHRHKYRIQKTN